MLWQQQDGQQFVDDGDDSGSRVNGCALGVVLGACIWVLIFAAIWLVRTW